MASREVVEGSVGLVLAGGGARGAYEIGVLSVLLPALEEQGQRPDVIVGTSVGALNAAFLASCAHLPADEAMGLATNVWRTIDFERTVKPIASPTTIRRVGQYAGQCLGLRRARLPSLLDPSPLRKTLLEDIAFSQIEDNVKAGKLRAVAAVATSAATSRSVVFHSGGHPRRHDNRRGIDYAKTHLTDSHVLASAAIPGVFPAVRVAHPDSAAGWYFDGGTRLNTPMKPVLELGVERIVVVALNPIAPAKAQLAGERRPDALEAAGQLAQALLVDPLVHDVQTLVKINGLAGAPGARQVPHIVVTPERNTIGQLARDTFARHYSSLWQTLRSRDIAFLGHSVAGASDALHGELLSYLFFAPEFADVLIARGRHDAERWLGAGNRTGIWQI